MYFENRSNYPIEEHNFHNLCEMLFVEEGITSGEVNLILTTNDEIKKLNKRYRGKNAVTDVLSFSGEEEILGDIVIGVPYVDEHKEEKTLDEELIIIFIHGVLHLLGYDHLSTQDQIIMSSKEKKYKEMYQEYNGGRE